MEIEVTDAFPYINKDGKFSYWSVAVYIIDFQMDIRNIIAKKSNKGWSFRWPYMKNFCLEKKEIVTFPIISFIDKNKNNEFMKKLAELAPPVLQEKILEFEKQNRKKKK